MAQHQILSVKYAFDQLFIFEGIIWVDFDVDQPDVQIVVNYEIEREYLEHSRVYQQPRCFLDGARVRVAGLVDDFCYDSLRFLFKDLFETFDGLDESLLVKF